MIQVKSNKIVNKFSDGTENFKDYDLDDAEFYKIQSKLTKKKKK